MHFHAGIVRADHRVPEPAVVGSEALAGSDEPLLDGYRAILPGNLAAVLSAFALIGLLASIQGIMFAYGRNLYSLSRAGYYPAFLSLTGKKKTPYWGLVVGAIIGFAALFIIAYGGDGAGSVVLNIAVWGAVLAYLLQMVSYVILRKKMPDIKRPFTSVRRAGRGNRRFACILHFRCRAAEPGLSTGRLRHGGHLRSRDHLLRGLRT